MKITLFATAWGPKHGGINAFNRDFAAGLAKVLGAGCVRCVVLDADDADREDAKTCMVDLVSIGQERRAFKANWAPLVAGAFKAAGLDTTGTCWVGHDVTSGAIALAAADAFGGSSALIHHMNYRAYKILQGQDSVTADRKAADQEELFRLATNSTFFAVGPRLRDACDEILGTTGRCTMLVPGFPDTELGNTSTANRLRAITFGRMDPDDDRIKQGRLAVAGFARAVKTAFGARAAYPALADEPRLTLLGLSADKPDEEAAVRALVDREAGIAADVPSLPFDTKRDAVFERLRQANLALMLSVHEGFGLTGWEAIAFDVPLIVSRRSGLHRLIEETLEGTGTGSLAKVLDVRGTLDLSKPFNPDDVQDVADAYCEASARLPQLKRSAVQLRSLLQRKLTCTWEATAKTFLDAMARQACGSGGQPNAGGTPSPVGPAPGAATVLTDLPLPDLARIVRPMRWFGRSAEVHDLTRMLVEQGKRAVLVMGTGGIGKTDLTKYVATEPAVATRFVRRAFVSLETTSTAVDMEAAIATALGVDATLPFDAALARLRGAPMLLVLDNLKTPAPNDAAAVEALLARLAGETDAVLLGSIRGEHAPMEPVWTEYRVAGLSPEDGAKLFHSIANWAPEDHPDLLRLVQEELSGMPLAIRLVAMRARGHRSLDAVWEDWKRLGVGLAVDPNREEGRLTSVRRSIRFSLDANPVKAEGRRLFAILGQSPAGLARKDIASLLGEATSDAQDQLVGVGLAISKENGRIDLLPPVRDFARRETPPTAEDAAAWATLFLAMTAHEGDRAWFQEGAQVMARLAPELANIEAAAAVCGSLGLAREGSAAAWNLYRLLLRTGRAADALVAIGAACRAVGERIGEAKCLRGLADIASARSEHDEARRAYAAALPIFRSAKDRIGEANCLIGLADVARARAEYDRARRGYAAARPIFRAAKEPIGEANCLLGLAHVARARLRHAEARRGYTAAQMIYRAAGARIGEASCLRGLAEVSRALFEHREARQNYTAALPIFKAAGERIGEANCLRGLAEIARALFQHEEARRGYAEALPIFKAAGERIGEANCLRGLADIARTRAEHEEARGCYAAALLTFQAAKEPIGEANCLLGLAHIARARSEHERARCGFAAALRVFEAAKVRIGKAHCLYGLAEIARARLEHEEARRGYAEALPIFKAAGARGGEANCLHGLAELARTQSDHEQARRLYSAALPIYQAAGDRIGEALCAVGLARVMLVKGQIDAARKRMAGALTRFREIHSGWNEADALQALGDIESAACDPAAATALYRESEAVFERIGNAVKAAESRARGEALGG